MRLIIAHRAERGIIMKINNKKVNEAIAKLNVNGNIYALRTENTRPDRFHSGKYFLYQQADTGMACPGTYGMLIEAFNTQNEFIEYVEACARA